MVAIKPTSVRTESEKATALDDYRAEHEAALERMTDQRRARLSAAELVRMKNGWRPA